MNRFYSLRFVVIGLFVILIASPLAFATGNPASQDEDGAEAFILQQDPPPASSSKISMSVVRSIESDAIKVIVVFPRDADELKVSLHNLIGSQIGVYPITSAVKGEWTYQFDTRGLPNGPYFVVLEALGQRITKKIMLTR